MSKKIRKQYRPEFKAKIVLAALREEATQERFHQSPDDKTPDEVYYNFPLSKAA